MRALLALVSLALVAALVLVIGDESDRGPERVDAVVERSGDAPPPDDDARVAPVDDIGRSPAEVEDPPADASRRSPGDGSIAETWEAVGRLLSLPGDEPLHGYTVALVPSGRPPRGIVPVELRHVTDDGGVFRVEDLDGSGPWDVFAFPYDPNARRLEWSARARVGALRGARRGEAERQDLLVRTGPRVLLRSPRPPEVAPEDLILEARGRISPFSSQIGLAGGFALARRTPEGFCEGRIPMVRNAVQDERFGVRAVTRDGQWSIAEVREGRLRNDTEATIDRTLEPRGAVRFRIEFEQPAGTGASAIAAGHVGFRLPLGDPDRDALDLPPQLVTHERNRPTERVGEGVFEIRDLPIGPVELRTRETGWFREGETRYEVVLPVQAAAVHGAPDPAVVRVRVRR